MDLQGRPASGMRPHTPRAACHAAQGPQRTDEGQRMERTQPSAGEPPKAPGRVAGSGAGRMATTGPARHRHRLASLGRSG